MRGDGEGGSILSFVLVGVILAGLLVGGVYFINWQNAKVSTPTLEQPHEQKPQQEEAKQSPPPAEPGNKKPESSEASDTAPQAGMAHELPATGPQETLSALLALGLLGGASAEYVRSRRTRLSL